MKTILLLATFAWIFVFSSQAQQSVARQWNEVQLSAIREDLARPPVQARNLYHVSIAMYDAWAVYDQIAKTYLLGKTINGILYPFNGVPIPADVAAARNQAISYAAFRVLNERYAGSPNAAASLARFNNLMVTLGYDPSYTGTNYANGNAADLGNYIASQVIQMGLNDASREAQNYSNADYAPINPRLYIDSSGNHNMIYPNSWQPLFINTALDQNGNPVGSLQNFVCPEWGRVTCFALSNPTNYIRNGHVYPVFMDPGAPPLLDTVNVLDSSSYYFKWGHSMVAAWSAHLSPDDNVLWDISPHAMGNVTSLPTTRAGQKAFYDFANGGDHGTGYPVNPVTGSPYTPQVVKRGDFTRVVSQFWADGPASETPPGHWYVLLNKVSDHPLFQKKYEGMGPVLDNLQWDVKAYFTLGGAIHDAAVAAWAIKGWYDSPRPISMIRKMAQYGQSSDPLLPSYHPGGIPLQPGLIELVYAGDPLAGAGNVNVGKIKVKSWKGYAAIANPNTNYAGVDWILADDWMPYQRKTFVTPPFAGYISGHSTFSRAAAEVLTAITGSPYFPGGMGEYVVPANSGFLGLEAGPSTEIRLQWATYRDASNQSSLSRIWGGIHPPFDDIPGRIIGEQIGIAAHAKAKTYFTSIVVPVTLLSFNATEKNCTVDLRWSTASEQNSGSFTILKSTDGIHFDQTLATVPAAGNASSARQYNVVDNDPSARNFYKLVATDLDGRSTAFHAAGISLQHCNLADAISVHPNPATADVHLLFDNRSGAAELRISVYDVTGKLQFSQQSMAHAGNNNLLLKTAPLTPGTYLVKVWANGQLKSIQRLVKL